MAMFKAVAASEASMVDAIAQPTIFRKTRSTITSLVRPGHYRCRRRVEFLNFINTVLAHYPGQEWHVIFDNLNTHKVKHDRRLARHKDIHLHCIPTHAFWLDQEEVRISILVSQTLTGANSTTPGQGRQLIDSFVAAHD